MPVGTSGATAGGSSGAIRAGAAFVEIFGKDRLTPTLNAIQKRMQSFGSFMSKLGGASLKAGAALLAPIAGLMHGALAKSRTGEFGADAQNTAARFDAAWLKAISALQRATIPILDLLIPTLEMLSKVVQQNTGIVPLVAGLGAGLLALGVAAKSLGIIMGAISLAVTAATSPVLLLIGGLVALAATNTDWRSILGKLGETFSATFQGMLGAFRSGQLELAANIALAGLKLAWHDTVHYLKTELGGIIGVIGDIAKMVVILKAAQAGASVGSVFGPIGTILGTAAGAGAGVLAVSEIDKAVSKLMSGIGDPGNRAALVEALAKLLSQVTPDLKPRVLRNAIDASRGLFSSPNFKRALGYGSEVKMLELGQLQVALAERANGFLATIAANSREVYT